jgi:RNA recognition motif-containing protein
MLQRSNANRAVVTLRDAAHVRRQRREERSVGEMRPMRAKIFRGNVFVANLPPDLSDDALAEAFDAYGIVLSAHIARDPQTGERLRYGFVDIATERAAERAVAAMNGASLGGRPLDVRISERQRAKKPPPSAAARPRRAVPRPAPSRRGTGDEAGAGFATVRRQPSFQVERRSLPRRSPPPR